MTDVIMTLEHALHLVRHHIPVFPCNHEKSPRTEHGFKDATTNERRVNRWWLENPDALIGVPTGIRFDVVDVDLQHQEARDWLARKTFPETRTHHTRSGGLHVLFRPQPGLTNSQSRLGPHVDVKTRGGYVIWWPAEGFEVDHPDLLAPMPEWIVAAQKPAPPTPTQRLKRPLPNPRDRIARYQAERDMWRILDVAATAPRGSRQSIYFWASKRLEEMVDAGLIDRADAHDKLFEAALQSADPGKEAVIKQAIRVLR